MHYRNGREARNGDKIVQIGGYGDGAQITADMDVSPTLADPASLIRALDADAIRARLDAIADERRALMTLLRAAERMNPDRQRQGDGHHA